MLKKPASFVLDSSKSSTGTRPPHISAARTDMVLLIRRTVRPRGHASGFNSPAALLNSLFEHPAEAFSPCSRHTVPHIATMSMLFSRNLSDRLRLPR